MNDEIKEILYFLSDETRTDERFYKALDKKKCKILLDYITRLQQENERLRKIEKFKFTSRKDETKATIVISKNDIDYKSRNKKAIEYIKENKDKYYQDWGEDDGYYDTYLGEYEINKLINILQGDGKE